MTGFLDRLVLRAHGVAATAPATLPGAVPDQLPDGDAVRASQEVGSPVVAPPSTLGPPVPPVLSPAVERSLTGDTAPERAPLQVDRQPSTEELPMGSARDNEAEVAKSVQTAATAAILGSPVGQPAPADPPVAPPPAAAAPAPSQGLLQRFIERLAVDNAAADAVPIDTAAHTPAVASFSPPVSIGYIEIIVAPPPPAARAPVNAARRSQGFAGYARVRRGLER